MGLLETEKKSIYMQSSSNYGEEQKGCEISGEQTSSFRKEHKGEQNESVEEIERKRRILYHFLIELGGSPVDGSLEVQHERRKHRYSFFPLKFLCFYLTLFCLW